MFIYYLLSIFGAFLQTVDNWVFWPGLVVVTVCFRRNEWKEIYLLAFSVGLLTDFLIGRSLGTNSMFLLALAAVIYLYRGKFKADWRAFLAILVVSQMVAKFL